MKLRAAYRYQIHDLKFSILIYYCVIVGLFILVAASALAFIGNGNVSVNANGSIGGATFIFLFVLGLNSFKENFLFSLQNSVSRKTLFSSRLAVFATLAVFMNIVDLVLGYVLALAASLRVGINVAGYAPSFVGLLSSMFFAFTILMLGYFLTILFFRLNKLGKVLVGAGVPVCISPIR